MTGGGGGSGDYPATAVPPRTGPGAANIGRKGGHVPPTFWLGNAKVNVPPH